MRYFEKALADHPVVKLVREVGFERAAKMTGAPLERVEWEVLEATYLADTEAFSKDHLVIATKLAALSPLVYNKGQATINAAIERQRIAEKPVRIALLKARQFGGTTLFQAEIFKDTMLRNLRRSMIIAHDLDSARHIRGMSARFYDNYKLPKPSRKNESDKWWVFKHPSKDTGQELDSHILIDTADELSSGHSLTNQNLHLSEVQLWRDAATLVKGLFPTVPTHPDTMIFMEGTGSGIGNWWYDFVTEAMDESSKWEFVFVPWFDIEDYTARSLSDDEKSKIYGTLDDTERALQNRGVTLEQLSWRRDTIRTFFKGIVEDFMQQYPADPEEAFSTSGRPVFAVTQVKSGRARSRKPRWTGDLTLKGNKVTFRETEKGLWNFWEQPEPGHSENLYVAGVDVAEGKAVIPELGLRGGDFAVCKILRRDTRVFVGRLRARIDPDLLAEELFKCSIYFGRLPMMIENNPGGSGNVVVRDLVKMGKAGTHSPKLLRRPDLRKDHEKAMHEYGWRTMEDTKREMIDELVEFIRDQRFDDPSENFWIEASTYIRDEKGLTNAQSRKYDDEVMANALAFQGDIVPGMPAVYRTTNPDKKKKAPYGADTPESDVRRRQRRERASGAVKTHARVMEETLVD